LPTSSLRVRVDNVEGDNRQLQVLRLGLSTLKEIIANFKSYG